MCPSEGISLIKAQSKEANILANIYERAYTSNNSHRSLLTNRKPRYVNPIFHQNLMEWTEYYKIILTDETVGGVIVQPVNKLHKIIRQIYVDPKHHEKEILYETIRQTIELYPSVKMWTLGIPKWDIKTKTFYENFGFIEIGVEATRDEYRAWYQKNMDPDDPYVMQKIVKLYDGQSGVDVEGVIIKSSSPRVVRDREKGEYTSLNSVVQDDSGSILFNRWNEQIELADVGDMVRVEDGVVRLVRGKLQLSKGYKGHVIKVN